MNLLQVLVGPLLHRGNQLEFNYWHQRLQDILLFASAKTVPIHAATCGMGSCYIIIALE